MEGLLKLIDKIIFCCRLWDIECGACLRVLEGHEELVRCIRFDTKRIVSGAYDGKIKVWDLVAALDPRAPSSSLCLRTLVVSRDFGSDGKDCPYGRFSV